MNIKEEFGGIFANSCIVIGKCENNTLPIMARNRISKLNLKKNNIKYNIEISEMICQKRIVIKAEPKANFCDIFKIVTEILRFENIFEGCFYQLKSYEVSGIEYIQKIKKYLLSYFESSYNFCPFPFQFSDKDYRRLFYKWKKRLKNWGIIHPMFLYATYTKGITADIKMALLLEVFEPIAEQLHDEGKITLLKSPYRIFSEKCTQCGNIVEKQVPNKSLHFADKLKAVIVNFGGDIFEKENIEKLIKYSVNVRNKIDHVKMENKECMSGKQCGFYLYKFCLLYRYIILKELQGNESQIVPVIISYRKKMDSRYPKCIIK